MDMSGGRGFYSPLKYASDRAIGLHPGTGFKTLMKTRLSYADNLFRKDLYAHFGCVNAIEFSNEGEWLVSGGDDRRVLLWNVEKAVHNSAKPCIMKGEHNSNIFCVGFDNHNSKIFSAGNDEQVIVHDISTGATVNVFLHEEAVYGLSIDPLNDNVYASACDDGRVLIWDIREPSNTEPFCLASYSSAFHAVMYNPVEPRLLATANSKEGVNLWDVRQPRNWLMKYGGNQPVQSCMSVRFNMSGTQILALRRRLPPVLFDIHSQLHTCEFDHPGYYNSCTMKSCCFAGDSDQFVLSGSDDFNLYMWKVPQKGCNRTLVDKAHMVLQGHRSIVNQVRFNPSNFLMASSGVEKIIKLWSPFSIPGSSGGLNKDSPCSDKTRKVYTHEEYISLVMRSGQVMTHDYSHQSMKEDSRMMAFFDSLVQREIEGLTSDSSLSGGNSDSWLFNVAGSVSLSEIATTSDGSSDGEQQLSVSSDVAAEASNAVSSTSSNGLRRRSPLTVAYADLLANRVSVSMDSSSHDEGDGDTTEDARTKRNEARSNQQGSMTESLSWLISRKRQQLLEAARLKYQQTQSQRPKRRSSEKRPLRSTSTRACKDGSVAATLPAAAAAAASCTNEAELTSSSSSSSSSSTSSSPSTPTSSCSLASVDEEEDDDDKGENGGSDDSRKRKFTFKIQVDSGSETADRRKFLRRKRRAHVLQDLTDSDSDSEEDSSSVPLRKRLRVPLFELGKVAKDRVPSGRLSASGVAAADGTGECFTKSGSKFPSNGNAETGKRNDVVCIAAQQTEENGEETSGTPSTPDSGIASQSFENGGHPSNGVPSTSASDSSELVMTRFKRIRNRGEHASRQPRNYRNVSKRNSE